MSKKRIIAIITVIVLLFAAGISVGVFLHGRGETEATDGNQVADGNETSDGNQVSDGAQTGEDNNENSTTNPDEGENNQVTPDDGNADGEQENADNEATDNEDEEENVDNEATNGNAGNNAGITTDTNVNEVGETTITRVEAQERLVSSQYCDWWQPMSVGVDVETVLDVNLPELVAKKGAITNVGGDEFVFAGQDITYVIEVTNNSNEDVKNIEITDRIPENTTFVSMEEISISEEENVEGISIKNSDDEVIGVKWIVTIPAGETVKARFTVNVNEKMLDENGNEVETTGIIANTAIANGKESKDPTNNEDEGNETKSSIIKAEKTSEIKRLVDEEKYETVEIAKIGDLITYTIIVENTGDAEGTTYIEDKIPAGTKFVSTPEGVNANLSEKQDSITWSIDLGPKGSETAIVTRQFTVEVISVGNVIANVADVGGTPTNEDKIDTTGIEVVKTAKEIIRTTIIEGKEVVDKFPITQKVMPGDVITYVIEVTNTGNITLTNVVVTDDLVPSFKETILSLQPGITQEFYVEYEVTQTDVDKKEIITNVATAISGDVTDDDIDNTIQTDKTADFSIEKTATLTKKSGNNSEKAELGDSIIYNITVKNVGSITLNDLEIVDNMLAINETVTLEAGETKIITKTYTVGEEDIKNATENNGTILNVATATYGDKTYDDKTTTDVRTEYNLTINYVYEDGSEAAETYTEVLDYNEAYNVTSPEITGYTADKLVVSGTMPAEEVEVTVIYTINVFKVTYYNGSEKLGEFTESAGEPHTIRDDTEMNVIPPEGYVFAGTWIDDNGTVYVIGDIKTINANLNLYAQFKKIEDAETEAKSFWQNKVKSYGDMSDTGFLGQLTPVLVNGEATNQIFYCKTADGNINIINNGGIDWVKNKETEESVDCNPNIHLVRGQTYLIKENKTNLTITVVVK